MDPSMEQADLVMKFPTVVLGAPLILGSRNPWKNARGPGSLGDPARGIPTLLDPV